MQPTLSRRAFLQDTAALAIAGSMPCPVAALAAAQSAADPDYASATDLLARLAQREISSAELVESAIGRIERLDGRINAVVVRDFERAREAARLADAALARGERRPLLGLPMTV